MISPSPVPSSTLEKKVVSIFTFHSRNDQEKQEGWRKGHSRARGPYVCMQNIELEIQNKASEKAGAWIREYRDESQGWRGARKRACENEVGQRDKSRSNMWIESRGRVLHTRMRKRGRGGGGGGGGGLTRLTPRNTETWTAASLHKNCTSGTHSAYTSRTARVQPPLNCRLRVCMCVSVCARACMCVCVWTPSAATGMSFPPFLLRPNGILTSNTMFY